MTSPTAPKTTAAEWLELVAPLLEAWEGYKASDANMEQAYYRLAKHQWANWEALKECAERSKAEGRAP